MFKNKLPISSLISIVVISIGAFFTSMFAEMYQRGISLDFPEYFLLIVGLSLFTTGIALFLKKRWTRIVLTISIIGFFLFLIAVAVNSSGNIYNISSLCIFSTGVSSFLILLLYNEKVSLEFGDKHIDKETEDILDQFE